MNIPKSGLCVPWVRSSDGPLHGSSDVHGHYATDALFTARLVRRKTSVCSARFGLGLTGDSDKSTRHYFHSVPVNVLFSSHSPKGVWDVLCVVRAVCVSVCVVLVLLLCIIVHYFKRMYECVYGFALYCIIVMYYFYYITVL